MDYRDAVAQQMQNTIGNSASYATPVTDSGLDALRARLESQVETARRIGFRARDVADLILGERTEAAACPSGGPLETGGSATLVMLVGQLEDALSRIESELGRL